MISLLKKKYFHILFLFIISFTYFLPLIIFGQIIIDPFDNLESVAVYDYVISKIWNGNFSSVEYFLAGEIKWYHLERILLPKNILHLFLDSKSFYFTQDIFRRIISYYSFYILAQHFKVSKFNSSLGAAFFSSILNISTDIDMAICLMPYIFYIFLKKDSFRIKHFVIILLIGLNSSFGISIFAISFLIPLAFILNNKKKNILPLFLYFITFFISALTTDMHLVYGILFGEEIHRLAFNLTPDLIAALYASFLSVFPYPISSYKFVFSILTTIIILFIIINSFLTREQKIRNLIYFILFIIIFRFFSATFLPDYIFIGRLEFLKSLNITRVGLIMPFLISILFIFSLTKLNNKKLKNTFYIFSICSILTSQFLIPLKEITENYLKESLKTNTLNELKTNFKKNNYAESFSILFKNKKSFNKKLNLDVKNYTTFDQYYDFENYKFIKNIVKDSRTISIGADPMVAVMNDIKVIDGYHTVYPLRYKKKFKNIIKKELDNNDQLKKYYENWGNRIYAFYNNSDNLLIDFYEAKKIGAEYVISEFLINNDKLNLVCKKCNNSNTLFLYKLM